MSQWTQRHPHQKLLCLKFFKVCCLIALTQIKQLNAHIARRQTIFIKAVQNCKRNGKWRTKVTKGPSVQYTLNAQRAVKQTTQPKNVGRAQVRIYAPREVKQKQNHHPDQETRRPPISMTNSQVPYQVILPLRSQIQKTNCATTPNE